MKIQNFDVTLFLQEYWQKKPMVVRNAFSHVDWLEPEDLAGLSLEDDAESRIISQVKGVWDVAHGPFAESHFSTLSDTDWTLLVQAVDQWVPEVREILGAFNFLPSWRLDDVMVSYAPVGGTVSQHFDFFDVFLIQGKGARKWQVGGACHSKSEFLPDTPVRILKDFSAELEITLNEGDMLYIPAKFSHLGVSIEDSLTYSIGFRAPSAREVIDGVATTALEAISEDKRYTDTVESLKASMGEITEDTVEQVQQMLIEGMLNKDAITSWLGQFVTERKYPEIELLPDNLDGWFDRIHSGEPISRNAASRFAYMRKLDSSTRNEGSSLSEEESTLFVDGQSYDVGLSLAEQLSNANTIDTQRLLDELNKGENRVVVETLFLNGALVFD